MQGVRGQKRTAPKTFDAGIALYAGMAAGSGGGQREREGAIAVQVTYKLCTSYVHFYTQKSTYFCKKDKKVSDTGREGGGEDRVSR